MKMEEYMILPIGRVGVQMNTEDAFVNTVCCLTLIPQGGV